MTKEEFIQLSAEYAAGSLQGQELEEFVAYLRKAAPQELNELREILTTTSLLPAGLEKKQPPPHVREELLKRIRTSKQAGTAVERRLEEGAQPTPTVARPGRSWMQAGVTIVLLAMVLGFGLYVAGLLTTIEEQNQRLVELQTELARKEELLNVLSAKRIELVSMSGLAPHTVGFGKVIWDPERRVAILQVSNLPPVPADKDYQLWVVKAVEGGKPISAGVFDVSSTASAYFKVEQLAVTDPGEIAAFAITLEPNGGVPAPTGEMYMAGAPKI